MKNFQDKTVSGNDIIEMSFVIVEGQLGLPDMIDKTHKFITENWGTVWVLEEVFEHKERIKAIPYLNPDVVIFQTTMMSYDIIKEFVFYLQDEAKWRPKEIWQIVRNDRLIVDSDIYDVFSIQEIVDNSIVLTKI